MTSTETHRDGRGHNRSAERSPVISSKWTSRPAFFGFSALLFAACTTVTILWCASMSRMGGMPMPGDWTMSMTWMRMPGQRWSGVAVSFLAMWVLMMVAMMLPSLIPMLQRCRHVAASRGDRRPDLLTASMGAGYFFVWTGSGIIVFPLGVTLAAIEMRQPALARIVPIVVGVVVLTAGFFQFTQWKMHHLACCRKVPGVSSMPPGNPGAAWRYGVRLGFHCCLCCANLMTILVVIGIMDLRVMAVVMAAITVERLAPACERVVHVIGFTAIGTGLFLIVQALGFG